MNDVLRDEASIKSTLQRVQSNTSIKWVVFGYKDGSVLIEEFASGHGNLDEVKDFLKDDAVIYIVYAYNKIETSEIGESVIERIKYVLINFVGSKVKPLQRARSSQHRVYLYNFSAPYLPLAGELQTTHVSEVTEEEVAKKLSGSRLEKHVEATKGRLTTGSTRSGVSANAGRDVLHFVDLDGSVELIKKIRLDTDPLNWVSWTYNIEDSEDITALMCIGSGTGGYSDAIKKFIEGKVVFILLALKDLSEGQYASTKYTLITWTPPTVKPLFKARSTQDRMQLYNFITKYLQLGAEWQVTTPEEISEAKLLNKIQGSVLQEKGVPNQKGKATINHGISKVRSDYKPPSDAGGVDWKSHDQESNSVEALKDVLNGKTTWVLFGYDEGDTAISLLKSGSGGYDEVSEYFKSDKVLYAVISIEFGLDDYTQIKFIFAIWIGENSKPTAKARASQHRVSLYNFVHSIIPLAGELQALRKDEISEELLRKKLIGTTQLNEEQQQLTKRRIKTEASVSGVEKFELLNQSKVEEILMNVRNDNNSTNWAIFGYPAGSNSVEVTNFGSGGLEDISKFLLDDSVHYIVLGLVQEDGDYQVVKYIFITYIGQNVKPLHKARSSQHRVKLYNHVQKYLQLAGEIQILSASDLNEKNLFSKLSCCAKSTESQSKAGVRRINSVRTKNSNVSFENEKELGDILVSLRSDSPNSPNYIVLGTPEDNSIDSLKILASGNGNIEDTRRYLTDGSVRYIIISHKAVELVDGIEYSLRKNIFVSWVGSSVKPMIRAQCSQHRVMLYNHCQQFIQLHGQIHAEKMQELTSSMVEEKFSGSRIQDSNKIEVARRKMQDKDSPSNSRGTCASENSFEKRIDISSFFKQDDIAMPLLKSLVDNSLKWVAFGYTHEDQTIVVVLDKGKGGLEEFYPLLGSDQVVYIVVAIIENEEATDYATKKFLQINWVGNDVKPLQKARSSQHRVALATQLVGKHLQLAAEFPASEISQITLANLQAKITGSSFKR